MHPSRMSVPSDRAMMRGLAMTTRPAQERAFLCPDTSMQNRRTDSPICGAAMPTQAGDTRIVWVRTCARATIAGSQGSMWRAGSESTGCGRVSTCLTATRLYVPLPEALGNALGPEASE